MTQACDSGSATPPGDGRRHLTLAPEQRARLEEQVALVEQVARASAASSPVAATDSEADLLLVGDLAKATGKTVRAIHLYEDLGLLRPHFRSKGRYRLFAADAVLRVRWIAKLQSLGLSLSDIQELAERQADADSARFAATRLREVYLKKLEETRARRHELEQLEAELAASLAYLDDCDTSCVTHQPVETCHHCERHTRPALAPELVAGARAH